MLSIRTEFTVGARPPRGLASRRSAQGLGQPCANEKSIFLIFEQILK
jgi:hypothetical protein